jgi:succinate-acetate transporter protein
VVPLQLLASVLGFLARDSLAGTAMGILSGSWLAVGLVLLTSPPGSTSDALGLFLLVAGTAMLLPATAALATKLVPALVLATTALRFLVTGLYQLTASSAWKAAAGLVGLLLAWSPCTPPGRSNSRTQPRRPCCRPCGAARVPKRSSAVSSTR